MELFDLFLCILMHIGTRLASISIFPFEHDNFLRFENLHYLNCEGL